MCAHRAYCIGAPRKALPRVEVEVMKKEENMGAENRMRLRGAAAREEKERRKLYDGAPRCSLGDLSHLYWLDMLLC